MKPAVQIILAVCLVVFGISMITAALCIDPPGEIHSSVLVAYGETLTFAGSLIGIDYRYRYHKKD